MSKVCCLIIPIDVDVIGCLYPCIFDEVACTSLPDHIIRPNRCNWKAWVEVDDPTIPRNIISELLQERFVYPDTTISHIHGCQHGIVLLNNDGIPIDIVKPQDVNIVRKDNLLTITAKLSPRSTPSGISKIACVDIASKVVYNTYVRLDVSKRVIGIETDSMYTVYAGDAHSNYSMIGNSICHKADFLVVANKYGVWVKRFFWADPILHCCDLSDEILSDLARLKSNRYMYVERISDYVGIALHLSKAAADVVAKLPGTSIVNLLLGREFPELDAFLDTISSVCGPEDKWFIEMLPCSDAMKQQILAKLAVRWV